MARETKEERLVRAMLPNLTEQLIELKHLAEADAKESALEAWCVSLLKGVLGFSASNGYLVRAQESRGKSRFDIIVSRTEKPEQMILVVEVKRLGVNLNRSDLRSGKAQLNEYLKQAGDVRWGILTNGYEWALYDFKSDLVNVTNIDIRDDEDKIATTPKSVAECAWDLLDFFLRLLRGENLGEDVARSAGAFPGFSGEMHFEVR